GRAALARDVEQRRQIAQLHGLRHRRQDAGGLDQLLRGLLLAFGIDDLGAARALGLGLPRDGADHALVEVDPLDLDGGHLDAPGLGLLVEHVLNVGIELVALRQHLVEVVLAQYPAQRGLRELAGGGEIIADLDDRPLGVHHPEIEDGADLDRDVVAGNHILRGHLLDDDAQIDPHHLLDQRHEQEKSRSLGAGVAAEREHHSALVFTQDAHRREQEDDDDDRQDGGECDGNHGFPPCRLRRDRQAGSTTRTRPSRSTTLMRVREGSGADAGARQISPLTPTLPSLSSQATVSPSAPISASLPVTTGCRRDRNSMDSTRRNSAAVATAVAPTTGSDRVKPVAPGGNIMIAPITKAAMPPTPITPNAPIWASATISATPSSTSAAPA